MFSIREVLFRAWYRYVSRVDKKSEILFMNYGYSSENQVIELNQQDEPNRYSVQLYEYLISQVPCQGKELVEIGSGRGGGLSYLAKKYNFKRSLGIDLNKLATDFSNSHYKIEGLSFLQGDAQQLPTEVKDFDLVLNVESSHRYPEFTKFLDEVKRVLRPGGYLLYTDFRYDFEIPQLQKEMEASGMKVIKYEVITPNVVKSLEKDDARRRELVKRLAPKIIHKVAYNFSGAIGTETYNQFASGKYEYVVYVLQK